MRRDRRLYAPLDDRHTFGMLSKEDSMIDAGTYGAINWVDLSTPDVSESVHFYRDLFGWSIETAETPMGDYYVGKVGDFEAAGMMQQDPDSQGMPAMWTTFIFVEDIDATVAKVSGAGGQILVQPFEIPTGARVAVVTDPAGAMFALIAGGQRASGAYLSMEQGRLCWFELMTRDTVAAESFYSAVFDWKPVTEPTATGTEYTVFNLADENVAGMMEMPAEVPAEAPAHWTPYFAVDDCAAAERRAVDLGGKVLMPTMQIEMGRFAVIEDPTGATFNLMDARTN
ncbi:MAG: VOC family protein [Acidimicrobiia bacterium]|nr:VOC family protein [Acidimicrobiia bacterium]